MTWGTSAYPLYCIRYIDESKNSEFAQLHVSDRHGLRSSNIHVNRGEEVSVNVRWQRVFRDHPVDEIEGNEMLLEAFGMRYLSE